MEVFMGTIQAFGFNYPPVDWVTCSGQIVTIAQYSAMFSLLGTFYGGDGRQTLGLPDLRGRMPIGFGSGPGLPTYIIGEADGRTSLTLIASQMPAHNHTVMANPANPQATGNLQVAVQATSTPSSPATAPSATNNVLGASGGGQGQASIWSDEMTLPVTIAGVSLNSNAVVGTTGNNLPVEIANPYLAINFCIAINGLFPPRH